VVRGSVYKRCQCRDGDGRRVKDCGRPHGSWGYTFDVGPRGAGLRQRRRQVVRSGFASREAAGQALAGELSLLATGVDLSRVAVGMVARVAPGATALQANAEDLPFEDATFDFVTCIGSLERFLDRRSAMREMRRVARPGARFCLMVRNARTFGWKVATQWPGRVNRRGHQDAGTLEEWTALFGECGFVVRFADGHVC